MTEESSTSEAGEKEWKSHSLDDYSSAIEKLVHHSFKTVNTNAEAGGVRVAQAQGVRLPYIGVRTLLGHGIGVLMDRYEGAATARIYSQISQVAQGRIEGIPEIELAHILRSLESVKTESFVQSRQISPRLRQILLPRPDGGYLSLTPISAAGVSHQIKEAALGHNEVIKGLRKANDETVKNFRRITLADFPIGGAKHVNPGGMVFSMRAPVVGDHPTPAGDQAGGLGMRRYHVPKYSLLLKHLNVSQANALSSNYAVTAAPIMAVSLFAHAMGLKIGSRAGGVAMIHNEAKYLAEDDFHSGFKRPQFQQRKASTYIDKNDYVGTTMALSLQPVATVNIKLSLIIEFDEKPDLALIRSFLREGRIAGGVIESYESVLAFDQGDDALFEAIPGNGFWLVDRQDLLVGDSPIDQLVSALGTRCEFDGAQSSSRLTPVVPAYALTTKPKHRVAGVRSLTGGTYPAHAYGEPLLGLAQYVSTREYQGDTLPFWRSRWIDDTVFAVSTAH